MTILLIVNLVLATLDLIAHEPVLVAQVSGALATTFSYFLLIPLVAGELLLIILSVVGLARSAELAKKCFKAQALILAAFAVGVVVLLFRALPIGISPGTGFWVPVFGLGFVAYCVYIFVRAFPHITSLRPWQPALFTGLGLFVVEIAMIIS